MQQYPNWIPCVSDFFFDRMARFATSAELRDGAPTGLAAPAYEAEFVRGVSHLRHAGDRWSGSLQPLLASCTRMRVSAALEGSDATLWPPIPTATHCLEQLLRLDIEIPARHEANLARQLAAFNRREVFMVGRGDCIFHSLRHQFMEQLSEEQLTMLRNANPLAGAFITASVAPGPNGGQGEVLNKASSKALVKRVQHQRNALVNIMKEQKAHIAQWFIDADRQLLEDFSWVEEVGEWQHSDSYIPALANSLRFGWRSFTTELNGPQVFDDHLSPQERQSRPYLHLVHRPNHYNSTESVPQQGGGAAGGGPQPGDAGGGGAAGGGPQPGDAGDAGGERQGSGERDMRDVTGVVSEEDEKEEDERQTQSIVVSPNGSKAATASAAGGTTETAAAAAASKKRGREEGQTFHIACEGKGSELRSTC